MFAVCQPSYFTTPDCNSLMYCYTSRHHTMLVYTCLVGVALFGLFVIPSRQPLSTHTNFYLGIPYLIPAVLTFRVVLAWSAKVVIAFDVCASLSLSFICNTVLTCLLALALDSRKLSLKSPTVQVMIACEGV